MKQLGALLVLAVILAGCTDAPDADDSPDEPTAIVAGNVLDEALRPITGATVVLGGGVTETTDGEGAFRFQVPGDQPVYALRVSAEGFLAATRALQSNEASPVFDETITLQRVPVQTADQRTYNFEANIACSVFAQAEHSHGGPGDPGSHSSNDCSQGTNVDVWEFTLEPNVRNVVIEAWWEPNSLLSERMAIFVEAPGADGEDPVLLYFNEGPPGVRAGIAILQAESYYRDEGGPVRVTVKIGAPEEDVAVGAAVNQKIDLFATAFYVLPGPSDYSVIDA